MRPGLADELRPYAERREVRGVGDDGGGAQPVNPLAAGNRRPSMTAIKSYANGQGNDPLTMMVLPSAGFPAIPVRVTCEAISM
jgi:hypothetical protein